VFGMSREYNLPAASPMPRHSSHYALGLNKFV